MNWWYNIIIIDPNFENNNLETPLKYSIRLGHPLIVRLLLQYGAKDEINSKGENILFYASKLNRRICVKMIGQFNHIDFSIFNKYGISAVSKTKNNSIKDFIIKIRKK